MSHDQPVIFPGPAREMTPEERAAYLQQALEGGYLWKFLGDSACIHHWQPHGPFALLCMKCGGWLHPLKL